MIITAFLIPDEAELSQLLHTHIHREESLPVLWGGSMVYWLGFYLRGSI